MCLHQNKQFTVGLIGCPCSKICHQNRYFTVGLVGCPNLAMRLRVRDYYEYIPMDHTHLGDLILH